MDYLYSNNFIFIFPVNFLSGYADNLSINVEWEPQAN